MVHHPAALREQARQGQPSQPPGCWWPAMVVGAQGGTPRLKLKHQSEGERIRVGSSDSLGRGIQFAKQSRARQGLFKIVLRFPSPHLQHAGCAQSCSSAKFLVRCDMIAFSEKARFLADDVFFRKLNQTTQSQCLHVMHHLTVPT